MFADDMCVFCTSVRRLQNILDVCQAYAESHGIIFNCSKTVCMMFKTIGVREGILLEGLKKIALKITICSKNIQCALNVTFFTFIRMGPKTSCKSVLYS